MAEVKVLFHHNDGYHRFPDGTQLRLGVVHAVELKNRYDKQRRSLGRLSLRRHKVSHVTLAEAQADRLKDFFDTFYSETKGLGFTSPEPKTNSHAFIDYVFGVTPTASPVECACSSHEDTIAPANIKNGLIPGFAYGLYPEIDSGNLPAPKVHSLLAIDNGEASISVLNTNGVFAIVRNMLLSEFYDCERFSLL